jgi:two-component system sensor histidine kinase YesM
MHDSGSTLFRSYRFYSFVISLALVFLALVVTSVLFYLTNRRFLQEYMLETNRQYTENVAELLDSVLYRASFASATLASDELVLEYAGSGSPVSQTADLEMEIRGLLSFFVRSSDEFGSVYVYSAPRRRVTTNYVTADARRFSDMGWRAHVSPRNGNLPRIVYRWRPRFDERLISIVRRLNSDTNSDSAVVINIPTESIRRILGFSREDQTEDLIVVSEEGEVLFSFDDGALGWPLDLPQELSQSGFVQEVSSEFYNIRYLSIRGAQTFDEQIARLRRFFLLIVAAVIASGVTVAFFLSRITYRPIRRIADTIVNQATVRDRSGAPEEIRFIEESILQFVASNRAMQERLAERFENLKEAYYVALQFQMNPHFLYNTLESIYWSALAAFDQADPVPKSLSALSRMLRLVLDVEELAVPLRQDVAIAEHYVDILQSRFPDQVRVEWDIHDEVRDRLVPKLLLQPLIENAYYHGIKPLRRPGTISIWAGARDGMLEVTVTDDGRGFAYDVLDELQAELAQEVDLSAKHIGLRNISQRLRLLFGEGSHVTLAEGVSGGAEVTVLISNTAPTLETGQGYPT